MDTAALTDPIEALTRAFTRALAAQYEAALCMLRDCVAACPPEHWATPVAKYPFWHVAYHSLCYADVYLSARNDAWEPELGPAGLHPLGRVELDEEYPSRRFVQGELLRYAELCLRKSRAAFAAESPATLAGPSGFAHLAFTRLELHVYTIRHIQHHAGQLGALLRKAGVATRWVKSGWREP